MNRNYAMGVALATLLTFFVGCGDDKAPLGAPCAAAVECASGACETIDGSQRCTEPCTAGEPCPSDPESTTLTCREGGFCGPHCTFSGMADGYLCNAETGTVRACVDGNDVADCASCGCFAFGGGVCISNMGCIDPIATGLTCPEDLACQSGLCDPNTNTCIVPAVAGTTCAADRYCDSELCHPDSHTCVDAAPAGTDCPADRFCASGLCNPTTDECVDPAPLGTECSSDRFCESDHCSEYMGCYEPGEPGDTCYEDGECTTNHCSTDGNTSAAGECLLRIGETCEIIGVEPHCDRCEQGVILEWCQREFCHETRAPCGDGYACRQNTGGTNTCFRRCDRANENRDCAGHGVCRTDGICSLS